jgi:hypothetical protein
MKGNGNKVIAVSSENAIVTWEEVEANKWVEEFYLRDPETRKFFCVHEAKNLRTEDVESIVWKCEAKGFSVAR